MSEHGRTAGGWEQDYAEYVAARAGALRTTAYLLCGDWHHAEDLVQTTLTRLFLAWRRIDHSGSVGGYARRTLVRCYVDERRRGWRRERSTAAVPERPAATDPADERLTLLAALGRLPRAERAAVVLRYWEDLSIAETAELLDVSEGAVKSACLRGLRTLRTFLEETPR